jgi:hypothetical protein
VLPGFNFEAQALLYNTGVGGTVPDADPAQLVDDFLTNEDHGALFPAALLDYDQLYSSGAAHHGRQRLPDLLPGHGLRALAVPDRAGGGLGDRSTAGACSPTPRRCGRASR